MPSQANQESLLLLRSLKKLKQSEMASVLGVGQSFYSQLEKGSKPLSEDHKKVLATYFEMPLSFFDYSGRQPFIISLHEGNFDKRATVPTKAIQQFHAVCGLLQRVLHKVHAHLELHFPYEWPSVSTTISPQELANQVRQYYGIHTNTPIDNSSLMGMLEDTGIFLTPMTFEGSKIKGFSFNQKETDSRVIIYNKELSGNHINFTVAHELGHLLLHSHSLKDSAEKEEEAHAFASELLFPQSLFRKYAKNLTLKKIIELKSYFHIPTKALIYQAKKLGLIDEKKATYFYIELSRNGFGGDNEPSPQPTGEIHLLRDCVQMLIEDFDTPQERDTFLGVGFKYIKPWLSSSKVIPLKRA